MIAVMRLIAASRTKLNSTRANLVQSLNTVAALGKLGLDVTLFVPPSQCAVGIGDRVRSFGIEAALDVRESRLLHSRYNLWPFVRFYARELRAADAVHVRSVALSKRLADRKIPHGLEIHAPEVELVHDGRLRAVVESHRDGWIRWLFPISRAGAEILIRGGAVPERVRVIPSGVDPAAFRELPAWEPPPAGEPPEVIYLGRLHDDRGLAILAALARRGEARVTLVGELEQAVRETDWLRVLPQISHREVPTWWGRSHLALLPYQRSQVTAAAMSPLKVLEAMAAGRPIIASDLPALREILVPGRTALFVEPDDVDAWVAAVRRIANDPELGRALATAARAEVEAYTWDARARRIAAAYGWRDDATARSTST